MSEVSSIPSYQEGLKELIAQLGQLLPAEQLAVFNADAQELANNYPSPLQLQKGGLAPDFSLPNATGDILSLSQLLQAGPVLLTFYRGAWCPYCNLHLNQLQQILPQVKAAGGNLIAISPQSPDHSLDMQEKNNLQFEVLTDAQNKVARQFTAVFKNGEAPIKAMTELGYDFYGFYEDTDGELAVPATFVIAADGTIVYAFSGGGDYRQRAEGKDILSAITSL